MGFNQPGGAGNVALHIRLPIWSARTSTAQRIAPQVLAVTAYRQMVVEDSYGDFSARAEDFLRKTLKRDVQALGELAHRNEGTLSIAVAHVKPATFYPVTNILESKIYGQNLSARICRFFCFTGAAHYLRLII